MLKKLANLPAILCALALALVFALGSAHAGRAQTAPEPERETLLNGLKILYWPQPGNSNVLLRLRIHSGAAFDLADKGGMMALLGDALFPDAATREYVTDELGGRLEVTTSHDAIDVTISGKASELERMIDLLRGAVLTTQLGAENVATLRNARIKLLSDKPATSAEMADAAIAARLFGTFPYGHLAGGTPASVAKLERADLMLGRERFLNADNATLAVAGGVEKPRVMRALRQLLGPWAKSERSIPATFRQPAAPDARVLVLNNPTDSDAEVRLAVRGLTRADNDTVAATLLARIVRDRWLKALPQLSSVNIRHETHVLPGMFVLSASTPTELASKAVSIAQEIVRSIALTGPSATELESARYWTQSTITDPIEAWLDVDTFKSPRPDTIPTLSRSVTPGDIQRVAARLFKDAPVATVVVGNYDQLKAAFAGKMESGTIAPGSKVSDPAMPTKKP
ncbi:MAG TPA: insulinase family protein [Pyrinomonadaceae bacterium]|nr:insulinase family protein [Pyrinomonadaceae bacterium]